MLRFHIGAAGTILDHQRHRETKALGHDKQAGRQSPVQTMTGAGRYYTDKLSAERLEKCYQVAPPRVCQYLEAEVRHVANKIHPGDRVLESGCGYGRILQRLATEAATVVGVDTSPASVDLARYTLRRLPNCHLLVMDAVSLGFADGAFDVVACLQNCISAFKVDRRELIAESVRVTRPGGLVLLSSYAQGFWDDRLEWFELQAEHGLIGEIDRERTGGGVIVCRDGFQANTVSPDEFRRLCFPLGIEPRIEEVDGSSLFCEIRVGG